MSSETAAASFSPFPSFPRVVVSVGVCGHRCLPAGSAARLRYGVDVVLKTLQRLTEETLREDARELFRRGEEPLFRLVSPLAEGADRLAARAALEQSPPFELQTPLPMARAEYEKDFSGPDSLREFRGLLAAASSVFEIQAAHPDRNHAYADAGRVMLNHCDLLIALWDGKDTGFIAGTAATVAMAGASHIPTVHIHAERPEEIRLIKDGFVTEEWEEGLRAHLRAILLPENRDDTGDMEKAARFAETVFRLRPGDGRDALNLEKVFARALEKLPPRFRWEGRGGAACGEPIPDGPWRTAYELFDRWASCFSARYRSCLVLRFGAPVVAVCFLAMGLYGRDAAAFCGFRQAGAGLLALLVFFFAMQMAMLTFTIILEKLDRRVMWHRKFFSFRVMAELLRQSGFLWPSGFCDVRCRHRSYMGEERKWTAWYYRALAREQGLPCVVVTHEYLQDWMRRVLDGFILNQMDYHAKRCRREGNISAKLFRAGLLLFMLGIIVSGARGYATCVCGAGDVLKAVLGGLALVLPSLAVFCTGFCGYAGYPANRTVSRQAEGALNAIREDMETMLNAASGTGRYKLPGRICYTNARETAERIHACCTEELMDWEAQISAKNIKRN